LNFSPGTRIGSSTRAGERADMAVLLAIVQRIDTTLGGLLGEVRALRGQIGRS
jgi:hypothetical protein